MSYCCVTYCGGRLPPHATQALLRSSRALPPNANTYAAIMYMKMKGSPVHNRRVNLLAGRAAENGDLHKDGMQTAGCVNLGGRWYTNIAAVWQAYHGWLLAYEYHRAGLLRCCDAVRVRRPNQIPMTRRLHATACSRDGLPVAFQ